MKTNTSLIKVRIFAYLIILFVSLIFFELLSLIGFATQHMFLHRKSVGEFSEIMSTHYKRIYEHGNYTGAGDYDPLTQMQFGPLFSANNGSFKLNEYGFLGNGSVNPLANEFPQKNEKTFRVVMLGGSTMFGSGVESQTMTIPSKLEDFINSENFNLKANKEFVQVLNFGHPGAHSSIELAKLSQYLIHLEPDLVISFDGFNDAWYALFEHKRQLGKFDHGVINWADSSYYYYECVMYGCRDISPTSFGVFAYILPNTTSLISSVQKKLFVKKGNENFIHYPPYKYSSFIQDRDGDFAAAMLTNYSAMAGLTCSKDVAFWGILQPHALEAFELLTESEKIKINNWEQKFGVFTEGRLGYTKKMAILYDKYEKGFRELNSKFSHCRNVKFVSYRSLFSFKHQEDYFVDNIHYSERGNKEIAAQMLTILEEVFLD